MNERRACLPITAVIPVKRLASAKSRLAARVPPAERSALVLKLLDHVLVVVRDTPSVQRCFVVSPDPIVRARATGAGAIAVDEGLVEAGQNAALEHARSLICRAWNPASLLVLSGDLPLLTCRNIEEMARLGAEPESVVIAPDHHAVGTNALLLHPPAILPFRFGPDSFREHAREAEARHLPVRVYRSPGVALDVDVPEDLDRAQEASAALAPKRVWG